MAQKGAIPWNKGISRTEEVKRKISEVRKARFLTGELIHPRGMLGKKHSDETKKKIAKGFKNVPRIRKSVKVLFICSICKTEKLLIPSDARNKKYCSYICLGRSKQTLPVCKTCNKKLSKSDLKYEFCQKCLYKWLVQQRKENGYIYKTSKNRQARSTSKYQKWRTRIFKRDNYTCQLCFKRGGELQADHIKPFAFFPKLRFILSNGRTLCIECHKTTDTYLKNKYNGK